MTRMTRKHFEVIAAAVKKAWRRNNPPFGSPYDEGYIALHNVFTYVSSELTGPQKKIVEKACNEVNRQINLAGGACLKESALDVLIDELCIELALTNEFFNEGIFREACK